MTPRRILVRFRRGIPLMVVTALLTAATGYFLTAAPVAGYSATMTVISGLEGPTISSQEISYISTVNYTLAAVAESPQTRALALQGAGLTYAAAAFAGISAQPVLVSPLMTITVVDPDAGVASALLAAIPQALDEEVAFLHTGSLQGVNPLDTRPFKAPVVARLKGNHKQLENAGTAALFGILIAAVATFMVDRVDPSVRGVGECEELLDLPVIGSTIHRRRPFGWSAELEPPT